MDNEVFLQLLSVDIVQFTLAEGEQKNQCFVVKTTLLIPWKPFIFAQ